MSKTEPSNIAASIRQKLLNKARNEQRPFAELAQYYAMERFLYRLYCSKYANKFVLKGGLLFKVWSLDSFRPTMDIDMLGRTENSPDNIEKIIREILLIKAVNDGITFEPESISTEQIIENADYEGIRVKFKSTLDSVKLTLQLDIGFGDIVYPKPCKFNLNPVLKDSKPPKLYCYSKESCIAEKLQTIVKLQEINSRMKDFYDIWVLINSYNLDREKLLIAITKTFQHRGTEIPETIVAFSEKFINEKQNQWRAFLKKQKIKSIPANFSQIAQDLDKFLAPLLTTLK